MDILNISRLVMIICFTFSLFDFEKCKNREISIMNSQELITAQISLNSWRVVVLPFFLIVLSQISVGIYFHLLLFQLVSPKRVGIFSQHDYNASSSPKISNKNSY